MDPSPVDGLSELLSFVAKGGSAAQVALAFLAWRIWLQFKDLLVALVRGQEQIKRAIVVSNPETARIFDEEVLQAPPKVK